MGSWTKITGRARRFLTFFLIVLLAPAASAQPLTEKAQMQAWADDYLGGLIAEKRSAGVSISVVQDGKLVFSKGYGFADIGKRRPMDPETSGVMVGSITKTFIATAIAQLVDRGLIKSLDDPVNHYFKRSKLRGDRGDRVTFRHLLTHRAGFEDVDFGYLDKRGKGMKIPIAGSEIERFMPEIVFEPGSSSNYSNWSFSLLGFLIEDITGQRVDDYLRKNIWLPLGMTQTSMIYDRMPANISRNYWFKKDGSPVPDIPPMPHPWIAPAGTIVSTANDMAKYMNAQIMRGTDGGFPLVSQTMFQELHSETVRNAAISNGFALGFWTDELSGAPTIEHGGSTPGFQNMMLMSPDKKFGIFISTMTSGLVPWDSYSEAELKSGKIVIKDPINAYILREAIADAFFSRTRRYVEKFAAATPRLAPTAFTGTYVSGRRNITGIESLIAAVNPASTVRVSLSRDGKGLLLNGYGPYKQVANGVFSNGASGYPAGDPYAIDFFKPSTIAFAVSKDGVVKGLVPGLGEQLYMPSSPIANPQTMGLIAAFAAMLTLTAILLFAWPQKSRFRHLASYVGLGAACLVTVFPIAATAGFKTGESLFLDAAVGENGRFLAMIAATNLLLIAALLLSFFAIRSWRSTKVDGVARWAAIGYRVHLATISISTVTLVATLSYFNLVGYHL